MPVAPRTLLNSTANDSSLEPAERVAVLRRLRVRYPDLVGDADTYIGELELQREAAALDRQRDLLTAREEAELRADAISRGLLTPEELDAAGVRSHADLDALLQEGTLGEILEAERTAT